jgi:PAS domain S-box-containing protein
MPDENKSPQALILEIEALRQRVAELEASQLDCRREGSAAPESYLREMAENIDEVFWLFDWQERRVLYASPAYETIWGRSVDHLYRCYMDWLDSVHPEDHQATQEWFGRVLEADGGEPREYRIVRPDGSIRWIFDRACAIRDKRGEVCRVVGFAKDITERKKTEASLHESQARLRAAIESLPFDFFMLDMDGRYVMQNSVCRANWGNLIGTRPSDSGVDAETLGLWEENNRRAFAGEIVEGDVVLEPHGKRGHYHNIISPIRDGETICGILGVNIDVTAREQARQALRQVNEQLESRVEARTAELQSANAQLKAEIARREQVETQLRQSEETYRTLVESTDQAIATVREDGVILFVNSTVAAQFGVTPEAMVGKTMSDFFPQPFADQQVARVRNVIRAGQGNNLSTEALVGGQLRWFDTTFEPVNVGQTNAVLIIARDVDDLVQARKQLETYREQMARADRLASLGAMSAMVAHELTQPLTVLRLSLQNTLATLRDGDDPSTAAEDVESSLAEIATMTDLIERFRGFARASSPRETCEVELAGVADHVVELVSEEAGRVRVSISVSGLKELPRFEARPKDMEQLFFALLINAIQAADGQTDRTVSIRGRAEDSHIKILFEDTCGGVDPQHVDRLFKPFFTTKADLGGTGLGLSVVQHILDRYQGKIRTHNRPGHGVTFEVVLPLSLAT